MVKKPSDYNDTLLDSVAIVGESDAFHFVVQSEPQYANDKKSGCGSIYTIQTDDNIEEMPIEEALDDGYRPCKQCVKWVNRMFDVPAHLCEVCGRVSMLVEADFHTVEVPHAKTGHKHTQVCADCRELIAN
jgi:hypothetical protein